MKRAAILIATLAFAAGACSEQTQADAERAADLAGDDVEANLEVAGEAIQDGAIEAADGISTGAANLRDEMEASDTEEAGPAPITGEEPVRD